MNGLPLALAQAGCFIGMTDCGVQKYIGHFDSTWSDLIEKQDQFPLQEYGERSMLTTWKVSYDQVRRRSELAAWLLRQWAFFYHDDFWYGLLAVDIAVDEAEEAPGWFSKLAASELEFLSAMGLLTAYSLADSKGGGSYIMHSVLHRWSRSLSLDADADLLRSGSLYLLATATSWLEGDEDLKRGRRLLSHVLHALDELRVPLSVANNELPAFADATHVLGELLSKHGKLNEAEGMYKLTLTCRNKALGPNHKSTLHTVGSLGVLYTDREELEKAEQMHKLALAGKEMVLGPDHASTLNTVNNLGTVYRRQGKLVEAGQMHQRALSSYEKLFGPHHISTLDSVNNLGIVHALQGKIEAEQMFLHVIAGKEVALGPNHDSILVTFNNLGNLYRTLGRLGEAEQMFQRALTGYEKALGKKASTVTSLSTVCNLGLLYYTQRRLDEAEQMYERALDGSQQIYGDLHQRVADVSRYLALIRFEKGEFFHLHFLLHLV
jgi:tetratricopeptide (TPR) repeat protein